MAPGAPGQPKVVLLDRLTDRGRGFEVRQDLLLAAGVASLLLVLTERMLVGMQMYYLQRTHRVASPPLSWPIIL